MVAFLTAVTGLANCQGADVGFALRPGWGASMARSGRPTALHSRLKDEQPQEADARVGCWPHHQLEAMDERFCRAIERAIERGQERPQSNEAYSTRSPLNLPPSGGV
jgi:hypothetical protein